ncbi:MAG: ABC transporter ATP-binding protein [Promethearchaeota archaeon]
MAIVDSIIAAFILYLVSAIINKQIPEEKQIPRTEHKKCTAVCSLILLGVSIGIRSILETIWYFSSFFFIFTTDFFMFGLMITLFFFIYRKLILKFGSISNEQLYNSPFLRIIKYFMIIIWIIAAIFITIPLLRIQIYDYDIFELGFYWAAFAVGFNLGFTVLVNRVRSIEKRIPKQPLKYAMFTGGLISYGIWSIQLLIFELYLKRVFKIQLYEQDIRVLLCVIAFIYAIIFFISLKKIFLPRAKDRSEAKILKTLIQLEQQASSDLHPVSIGKGKIILDVKDLTTYFYTEEGVVHALENVSFKIHEGEVLGLVGETGCGKSVSALSILRVIRPPGKIEKGRVFFEGEDLLQKTEKEILQYRGKDITMIFQDPLNSLNPVFKIGKQISEVFLLHMQDELFAESIKRNNRRKEKGFTKEKETNPNEVNTQQKTKPKRNLKKESFSIYSVAREWSIKLLRDLNIPHPEVIIDRYPHELSGGMRQRVQIAMGLACRPKLLIADEPTTALDVTIQNQILKLMKELHQKYKTTILFISHDLGIISKMSDHVAVMYSGSIVEYGKIQIIFSNPYHPYTKGLIKSIPIVGKKQDKLSVIPGIVPNLIYPPSGCRFHPRCQYCFEPCDSIVPKEIQIDQDHLVACHLYDSKYKELAEISKRRIEES